MPPFLDLFLEIFPFWEWAKGQEAARIAVWRDTPQNCSLTVNCAERGPPNVYSGLCPPKAAPPPNSRFVVDPGPTLPKEVSNIAWFAGSGRSEHGMAKDVEVLCAHIEAAPVPIAINVNIFGLR
jgi:hypothetical protein